MRSKRSLAGPSACILASSPSSIATTASRVSCNHPSFLLTPCAPSTFVDETVSSLGPFYVPPTYHPESRLRPTLMRGGAMGFAGLAPRISKQMWQDVLPISDIPKIICRFVTSLTLTHMFTVIRNSLNLRSRRYIRMLM